MAESKPPAPEQDGSVLVVQYMKVPWQIEETSSAVKSPQDQKGNSGLHAIIDEKPAQVKASNILEQAKDRIEVTAQASQKGKEAPTNQGFSPPQKNETPKVEPKQENGLKTKSLVEKAKKEFNEIVHKDSCRDETPNVESQPIKSYSSSSSENKDGGLNILKRTKEESEATLQKENPPSDRQQHNKETQRQSGPDEITLLDKVEGPSVVQGAKEEQSQKRADQSVILHLRRRKM
ncbi:hypothetical protein Ancab_027506 [Ancistrocladus abbreviatus]